MIKAIPTRYKGYHFRSRLEARYAVFFDALGLKWEYEPEGFELPNGERYLPDFYLPEQRVWVEVKPETFEGAYGDVVDLFIQSRLVANPEERFILLRGTPSPCFDCFDCYGVVNKSGELACAVGFRAFVAACMCDRLPDGTLVYTKGKYGDHKAAALKARSARFEHGESGAT